LRGFVVGVLSTHFRIFTIKAAVSGLFVKIFVRSRAPSVTTDRGLVATYAPSATIYAPKVTTSTLKVTTYAPLVAFIYGQLQLI
jgi:hypothetical protein